MANTIRIKRRAAGGAAGAPASLANAELAFNEQDDVLYYGKGTGGAGGTATTVEAIAGRGAFVGLVGNQSVAGVKTFTGEVYVPAPTATSHAATKNYVDLAVQGLNPKQSVRAASTGNIATLSGTMTIDGVALAVGNRVLVKDQTTASQNGVYVVSAATWTRAPDADTWPELISAYLFVEQGTINADMGFLSTVNAGGALGSTAVTFVQFNGAGQVIAGAGLTKNGNTLGLGTPGTLTTATTNTVTSESHTHSVTFPVTSVAGKTGTVTLAKSDVGLGNVDNTNDASKPVSTATQTALDLKANTATAVEQSDIGTAPNQVPLNQYLGTLAFQSVLPTATPTSDGLLSGSDKAKLDIALTNTGPQTITSNTGNALTITQTGAGNALVVEDSTSPDSTPFVIDANGRVIVGHTTHPFPGNGVVTIAATDTQGFGSSQWSNNTYPINLVLGKSRSETVGVNAIVNSGDAVGRVLFKGDDGAQFIEAARISGDIDGTPGLNDMPGRLVFSTTPDGSSTPVERMRIGSDGRVSVGPSQNAATSLTLSRAITGATTSVGTMLNGSIQSDVTGACHGYRSSLSTQAAAFTISDLYHFSVFPGTFGAGSSVTNQYGFVANSTLTGATNNYGFFSSIPAGTGRWGFYAAGTAGNYLGGRLELGLVSNAENVNVYSRRRMSGGTNAWNIYARSEIQSDVTSYAAAFQSEPTTAAAAFTLSTLDHYSANQGAFGAGSVVTNQTGFRVGSSLIGATNNYGFFSSIPAGTGRWNFYAGGTAANYFAGETTIVSGFTIGRTVVTSPAASDGNVFSGVYTPTLTNQTNVASSTPSVLQYMRVGSTVTVSGQVTIAPTATGNTLLGLSLPIATSLTNMSQVGGTAISQTTTQVAAIYADTTNNCAIIRLQATSTTALLYSFQFTYRMA